MCGIAGVIGGSAPAALDAALRAMGHRGPDDSGCYVDPGGEVGLAHTRLAILDPSPAGHQPMISSDGSAVLVYNGEVYNFRELRSELVKDGWTFRGHSDTEVLLTLYRARGEDMLSTLNGMFAFAIWDARRQRLFIARDALGVKPLYYAALRDRFVFASEIKTLLCLAPDARELDAQAIDRYLTFLWCPGDGTPLKSVRKLLPGQAMTVRPAGPIERRWSWYRPPVRPRASGRISAAHAIDGATHHLREAVRRQMVSDVPVGAFLSGGLDSSATVVFAREQDRDIRCFTIEITGGAEAGSDDDLPYARKVARHLGVALDVVRVDAARMASDLERMVAHLDEPLADPAALNVLYISRLARENGIKVLLSGVGGDDLFSGYRRHHALRLQRWCQWLPAAVSRQCADACSRLDVRRPSHRRLAKLVDGADLRGDAGLVHFFRWIPRMTLRGLYAPALLAALEDGAAETPMLEYLSTLPADTSALERMLALDQRFFLADHNLIYTDKMSMAAGVEVRVPFLDTDLVAFAARIPDRYKQRGSVGKWVLKKAMEPYLPRDVIYRRKSGFGVPLRRWLGCELRGLLSDLLSPASLERRGLFSPRAVQQLIADTDSGRCDGSYTLLALLCTEIWCRIYVDRSTTWHHH